MNAKGQITLFIILGIVLLLTLVLSLAIFTGYIDLRPPEEQVITDVPTELQPLLSLVRQCQQAIGAEAIRLALATGGYIDPARHGIIPFFPPRGTGVFLEEDQTVAYWHHLQDQQAQTRRPNLYGPESSTLANQIADYIDERLEDCVEWESLPEYEIERGMPVTRIEFRETETDIITQWNVVATTPVGTTTFPSFTATVQAPVRRLFRAADEILAFFIQHRVPEQRTLDWLALYASGETSLPPFDGGLRNTWRINIYPLMPAETELHDVLTMQAASLQVVGSRDFRLFQFEDEDTINDLYLQGLVQLATPVQEMRVGFSTSEDYGLRFRVNGNPAVAVPEMIRAPGPMAAFMPPLVDYRFQYDVTYPLLITLEEDDYTLRLGYEVNIQNSRPQPFTEPYQDDEGDYCASQGGSPIDIRVEPQEADATVTYTCGGVTCGLGVTENGRLETTLPSCVYGILEARSDELVSARFALASDQSLPLITQHVQLHEEREVRIRVQARELYRTTDDMAENIGISSQARDTTASVVFLFSQDGGQVVMPDEDGIATMYPGVYDLFMIDFAHYPEDDPFIIPEQYRCVDVGFWGRVFTSSGDRCYDVPQINFTSIPVLYAEVRGIEITEVPDTLTLIGLEFDPQVMQQIEDLEFIGALFDLAETLSPEDVVQMS